MNWSYQNLLKPEHQLLCPLVVSEYKVGSMGRQEEGKRKSSLFSNDVLVLKEVKYHFISSSPAIGDCLLEEKKDHTNMQKESMSSKTKRKEVLKRIHNIPPKHVSNIPILFQPPLSLFRKIYNILS